MKYSRKNVFLFFSFFSFMLVCTDVLIGQIQVSNLENLISNDEHPRKGFIKGDSTEYFIEQGATGTKVWQVENGALNFIHELKIRPTDSKIDLKNNTYENNSNLIYDGQILFEFYKDYIYLIDFVKGKTVEIVDLRPSGYSFPTNFQYGKNFFYFEVWTHYGSTEYVRYDRNKKQFEVVDFYGHYFNSKMYNWNQDGIIYFDLETNKTHQLNHNVHIIGFDYVVNDPNIALVFQDSFNVYRLLKDNTIDTLDCKIPKGNKLLYYCNQSLIYGHNEDTLLKYFVIDLESCEVVYRDSLKTSEYSYYRFKDSRSLYNAYILLSNDDLNMSTLYLYDIKNKTKKELKTAGYPNYSYNNLRINDALYFVANDGVYKLDLSTDISNRLIQTDSNTSSNIILSDVSDKDYITISYQYEGGFSLLQLNERDGKTNEIFKQDVVRNVGIYKYIKADLWVDDKYFAATDEAVFMLSEARSYKILDNSIDNIRMSQIFRKNDHIYLLFEEFDSSYVLKVNVNNLTFSKINLPPKFGMGELKMTENYLIVNYSSQTYRNATRGYFDLNTDNFISVSDFNVQTGNIIEVSGNNILYHLSQNNTYHIFSPIDGTLIPLNFKPNTSLGVISDKKGGFYLNVNNNLSHVNGNGELTTVIEDFKYPYFRSGTITDDMQSFAFYDDKELVLVLVKNGEVRKKVIKIDNSFNHYNFFWRESEYGSFIEFIKDHTRKLYYYSFDSEPIIVTVRDYWYQGTIILMQNKDYAVIAYRVNGFIHQFDKFDLKTLKVTNSIKFSPGYSYLHGYNIQLNENEFLCSFDDGTHGSEPWVFNIETFSFTMLSDLRSGFLSSDISNFSKHPTTGDIYFIGTRTEGDMQLFKIEHKISSLEQNLVQKEFDFIIYPVPSSHYLKIDHDFESIKVTDIKGNIVLSFNKYHKGDVIDIGNVLNGLYFLSCSNDGQYSETKSFIVSK
ncbi:MAG: T9SS type A sorting domain-containing protein [Lewinellaceae bacterium]|nr:T9SS type A sorting domain-containing protein [Lewinellaceae bacterium]